MLTIFFSTVTKHNNLKKLKNKSSKFFFSMANEVLCMVRRFFVCAAMLPHSLEGTLVQCYVETVQNQAERTAA